VGGLDGIQRDKTDVDHCGAGYNDWVEEEEYSPGIHISDGRIHPEP
jgi:hypothetical protein